MTTVEKDSEKRTIICYSNDVESCVNLVQGIESILSQLMAYAGTEMLDLTKFGAVYLFTEEMRKEMDKILINKCIGK